MNFNNLKLHKIKAVKLYLLNNLALISKLIWLEPSSWSAVTSKKCDLDEL